MKPYDTGRKPQDTVKGCADNLAYGERHQAVTSAQLAHAITMPASLAACPRYARTRSKAGCPRHCTALPADVAQGHPSPCTPLHQRYAVARQGYARWRAPPTAPLTGCLRWLRRDKGGMPLSARIRAEARNHHRGRGARPLPQRPPPPGRAAFFGYDIVTRFSQFIDFVEF